MGTTQNQAIHLSNQGTQGFIDHFLGDTGRQGTRLHQGGKLGTGQTLHL